MKDLPKSFIASPSAQSVRSEEAIQAYDELKLKIAAVGQAGMQRSRELRDEESARQYQALLARLAEDRFNLAVLGQFSRGKSTLMNAILGVERLPAGLLPHTSVITTVAYGEQERILIRVDGWSVPNEVPLSDLAEYVTEKGNPGNRRRVLSAEIQLPVEILRRGLFFIDTPGVGSAIVANTATTRHFLPEADSAIFVSGFDSPLGDAEIEFLKEVHRTVGKVFVVVNKLDLVSAEDKDTVLDYVRERLAADLGDNGIELFGVSARDALRGKLENDEETLQRSGLKELESALVRFLANEKTTQLCSRVLDRLIFLIERERIEVSLLGSAPNSETTLAEIKSTIETVHARRRELVASIRSKVSDTIIARVVPRLDAIFAELKVSAVRRFGPPLLDPRALFESSPNAKLLNRISSFLANELTRRLRACSALIETEVELCAGVQLDELKRLPAETWSHLVRIGKGEIGATELVGEDLEPLHCAVAIDRVSEIESNKRIPWRIYFVPLQWITAAVNDWFERTISELVADYRTKADSLIALAADDYVAQINQEIEKRIDICAARLSNLVTTANAGLRDQNSLDSLLRRAMDLRNTLVTAGIHGLRGNEHATAEVAQGADAATHLAEAGCPVCDHVSRAIFEFLSKRQYELSADETVQIEHARAGGFCGFHTWMYATFASPHGISRAYPELLTKRGRELRQAAKSSSSADMLANEVLHLLPSVSRCAVCDLVRTMEIETIAELVSRRLPADGEGKRYGPALCLPHLFFALKAAPGLGFARTLALASAAALERAADGMKRFTLKFDAVRGNLTNREERRAHSAGLSKLVGDRRVMTNWIPEDRI